MKKGEGRAKKTPLIYSENQTVTNDWHKTNGERGEVEMGAMGPGLMIRRRSANHPSNHEQWRGG